jgi:hypothetical protein
MIVAKFLAVNLNHYLINSIFQFSNQANCWINLDQKNEHKIFKVLKKYD